MTIKNNTEIGPLVNSIINMHLNSPAHLKPCSLICS